MGYFLLVPVTTTMTTLGTALATILQLIAMSALAIVLLVDRADWTDRKDCRGSFLCALTPQCPTTFFILMASNLALYLLLPLLQRALAHGTDSKFWLRHRTNCKKCDDFQELYCNQRPCWLCEWTWCDELEKSRKWPNTETDSLDAGTDGQYNTPVPFLDKSLHSKHSQHILSVLASLESGKEDDFLLCKYHVQKLAKTELEQSDGIESLMDMDETSPLAPFSVTDPGTNINKFDPRHSMHEFLRKLYAAKGLFRTLPYQLFYKSKLYDSDIKDPQDQNKYWMEIKKLRRDHTACGKHCVLYENKSTASGKLKLEIRPSGMDKFAWRLDAVNDRGKVIPDDWEYEYFNDASVLALDFFDVREPVRECPLRTQGIRSTV